MNHIFCTNKKPSVGDVSPYRSTKNINLVNHKYSNKVSAIFISCAALFSLFPCQAESYDGAFSDDKISTVVTDSPRLTGSQESEVTTFSKQSRIMIGDEGITVIGPPEEQASEPQEIPRPEGEATAPEETIVSEEITRPEETVSSEEAIVSEETTAPEEAATPKKTAQPEPSVLPAVVDSVDRSSNIASYIANLAAANNMFVTQLHDRLGEAQYTDALTGEQKVTSMWLRNVGGHNRFRDSGNQSKTQSNRYIVQLGGDIAQWSNNSLDGFHLGMMAGYGNAKSTTQSGNAQSSKGSVEGYTTGIYGTWYANDNDQSGLYIDTWTQYSWFNNSVKGGGLTNNEEYKSKGFTASLESGYTFKVGESQTGSKAYFFQPKAQVTWMGVKADDHKETGGIHVSGEGDGNIQTRLGLKAFIKGYSPQDKSKDPVFQPFIEANWLHNSKDFGITLDNSTSSQNGATNIAELKVGLEGQITNRVNIWGNIGQQMGDQGYSDTAVVLGAKYNF